MDGILCKVQDPYSTTLITVLILITILLLMTIVAITIFLFIQFNVYVYTFTSKWDVLEVECLLVDLEMCLLMASINALFLSLLHEGGFCDNSMQMLNSFSSES